jgi:hypothetical protein
MVKVDGALLRGPDGKLYFVPTKDLKAFRLPDDEQVSVEQALAKHGRSELAAKARRPTFKLSYAVFGRLAQRPKGEESILGRMGDIVKSTTVVAAAHGRTGGPS